MPASGVMMREAPHPRFRHFADTMYCSASEERLCALPGTTTRGEPGACFWYKPDGTPVVASEDFEPKQMDPNKARQVRSHDVWDPIKAGAISTEAFPQFSAQAAAKCVRGKHIYIIGESTTRDLYYHFTSLVGLKPDRSPCMNIKGALCTKSVSDAYSTRMSYQFISQSNASREIALARNLTRRAPDVVFAYCMSYDWLGTLKKDPYSMGNACMQLVDTVVLAANPQTPVYLLGPIYPPKWVGEYEQRPQYVLRAPLAHASPCPRASFALSLSVLSLSALSLAFSHDPSLSRSLYTLCTEKTAVASAHLHVGRPNSSVASIFASINHAAGVSCTRNARGEYRASSSRAVRGVIDRYKCVGRAPTRTPCHAMAPPCAV